MDDPWIYVFLLLNGWTCTFHLTWQAQNGRMGRILTYVSCIRKGLHVSWFSALKEGPSQIKSDCSKGLFRCTRAGTFYSTQHYISAWWHLWMSKKKLLHTLHIIWRQQIKLWHLFPEALCLSRKLEEFFCCFVLKAFSFLSIFTPKFSALQLKLSTDACYLMHQELVMHKRGNFHREYKATNVTL